MTERAAGELGGDQDELGLACGGWNQDGQRREEDRRNALGSPNHFNPNCFPSHFIAKSNSDPFLCE